HRAPLEVHHPVRLPELLRLGEIGAARIGDGGNAHRPPAVLRRRELLQPAHARLTQAFRVGHDVRLRHRHEVPGAEKAADLDLVLERESRDLALLPGEDRLLFVSEPHQSCTAPESRTALPHFATSALWNSASDTGSTDGCTPRLPSCALYASERTTFSISERNSAATSAGRPAGANTAHHAVVSKPLRPASSSVGTSGRSGERLRLLM